MKKNFLMIVAMFAFSSSCFAATQVRVSDYNLNQFYHAYNNACAVTKNNWTFTEFPKHVLSSEIYDTYMTACGPYGHGVAVGIFVNKQGHVSKINIAFNGNNETARNCSTDVFFNVLVALGTTERELAPLSQQLKSRKNRLVVYCSALKRYIVADVSQDPNGVMNIRLIGAVD